MHILFCRQNQEEEKEMDALEAILTRRSTRNYKPDAVEAEKLDLVLKAAG